jgi:hypothetical protein
MFVAGGLMVQQAQSGPAEFNIVPPAEPRPVDRMCRSQKHQRIGHAYIREKRALNCKIDQRGENLPVQGKKRCGLERLECWGGADCLLLWV